MKLSRKVWLFAVLPCFVHAADTQTDASWADRQRSSVQKRLGTWSKHIDGWLGETDPARPASANLRLMTDAEWNKDDGLTVTPRIRGRIKLPAWEKKVHLIFGDESFDDELPTEATGYRSRSRDNGKAWSNVRSRDSNASLAVRFSDVFEQNAVETDFDLGARSGTDLYARAKIGKQWQLSERIDTRLEQVYRYGVKSRHHVRTNWETRFADGEDTQIANQAHIQYEHDKTSEWTWGDSLFRQHNLAGYRTVNYGIRAGGRIENRKAGLDSYGPFATYRQPVWKNWIFAQTEVNYYNNRPQNRKHTVGTMLRLEALF